MSEAAVDWNLVLGFVGVGIVLVGGFVKLRVDATKQNAAVCSRLDKIETRLEIDDKGAADRTKLTQAMIDGALRDHEIGCANFEPNTGVHHQPVKR
jgi:hypothetical protein